MLATSTKIKIAQALNFVIVGARSIGGLGSTVQVSRRALNWSLDLNEGIELAIYLGVYQSVPPRVLNHFVRPGSLVLDIGANMGAFSLPLARRVGPTGRLIAIEPTDYALSRLAANARLNPDLTPQLILVQAALCDDTAKGTETEFYSSWPLRNGGSKRHGGHRGRLESAKGARYVSLDTLLGEMRAAGQVDGPVTFVKLDVDGNELEVLRGGRSTFAENRPGVLIELAPYIQDEVPQRFEELIKTLGGFGYRLKEGHSGKPLPMSAEALRRMIGDGPGIDAVAWPL